MKKILFCLFVLASSTSFAQDMSRKDIKNAYMVLPDGGTRYIGKCKVHDDYKGKTFNVTEILQAYAEPMHYTVSQVRQIVAKVGTVPFKMMMKHFFSFSDTGTDQKMMKDFVEYADDITVERIQIKGDPRLDLFRFNVGYGGGNGGFLVLLKTAKGYQKMHSSNDGDMEYCDLKVWAQ